LSLPKNPRSSGTALQLVGRLGAPFGVRGEIKCRPASFGPQAFAKGRSFSVGGDAGARTLVCTGVRTHHETLLLSFEGIASPEEARLLTNRELFAAARDVPLEEGEYLDRDLIDCDLIDPAGTVLGRVVDVQHFPAQDCLVVGPHRLFVPLVKAFVRKIDVAARRIDVDLPEGLLEP
jgi:16S rRNA processing protein RimM